MVEKFYDKINKNETRASGNMGLQWNWLLNFVIIIVLIFFGSLDVSGHHKSFPELCLSSYEKNCSFPFIFIREKQTIAYKMYRKDKAHAGLSYPCSRYTETRPFPPTLNCVW
jgi:hypothetical protein